MVPHGLRTQLGGSIRNRNSLPIVLLLLFSCSVVSDSLRPHELQHIRLPCPSLSLRVCSNSCALSWWCHPTISSSVALLSSCPESFPASVSWLFASGGQSIGASASASALPMNIQGWFPLGLTGLILTCSINMLLQKRSQMCHIHTLAKKKCHCAMRRGEQNGSSGRAPTPVLPSALRSRPKWWWPSCKAQMHAPINWWKQSPYS